ncbi:DUF4124 domain-containing protein [Teredinibacter sp. KSP-S5-2]|uniref:DUF4124 domain-containing protein n=1 Tax=Teredinibacter sp. KSP-S5-2 TaxID=3034506 RepID=UPI0029345F58|nr:DUF4124 domain-containing protein [Teredinibacter sp. KSP-S5-2]WNO10357.1 DUF4124 domain-containing protein [Teredinibacter sp. KSP-S5-2]
MKKLIFKVVVMVAVMVGISNYMLYLITGKSPFSASNFKVPDVSSVSSEIKKANPMGNKETAYKWTDENGVVHYSSEPPPEQIAEKMEVNPDTNLVQGLRKEEEEVPGPQSAPAPGLNLPDGSIYNPENIKKLVDDAKEIQNMMNERNKQMENL